MCREGVRTRLTFDAASDRNPVWSPDGASIVFASNRKGRFDLYRKTVDSVGAEELLYANDLDKTPTSWSADGKWLLYYTFDPNSNTRDLWALPVTRGAAGHCAETLPCVADNVYRGRCAILAEWPVDSLRVERIAAE